MNKTFKQGWIGKGIVCGLFGLAAVLVWGLLLPKHSDDQGRVSVQGAILAIPVGGSPSSAGANSAPNARVGAGLSPATPNTVQAPHLTYNEEVTVVDRQAQPVAGDPHPADVTVTEKQTNKAEDLTVPAIVKPGAAGGEDVIILEAEDGVKDQEGRFSRVRLVRREGCKYPIVRQVEELQTNREGVHRLVLREMVGDHLIVTLRHAEDAKNFGRLLPAGYAIRRMIPNSPVVVVSIPVTGHADFSAAEAVLAKLPGVSYAGPDWILRASFIPNDASFAQQWALQNVGQTGGTADADIDAAEAWAFHTGDRSVLVGVIDSGIDLQHPDLAANLWRNSKEIPDNGIDDDGNGYIDDVQGWNFIDDNNNPDDDHFHGTHVAGTIGAAGNNGAGVTGVCWQVTLVPLKFLGINGSGYTSDAVEAVRYATAIGCDLTNNSWGGGGFDQALKDAIDAAGGQGCLFVTAAGNESRDNDTLLNYPASYTSSNVIVVAASDHNDAIASFSNHGDPAVHIAAPGVSILNTLPTALTSAMSSNGMPTQYGSISGTSMAAPHVSGALALLKAYDPSLSGSVLKDLLLGRADTVTELIGKVAGARRLNIASLLDPNWIPSPPRVEVAASTFSDSEGNGDQSVNPGEILSLTPTFTNLGTATATNLRVEAVCGSGATLLSSGTQVLGSLASLASLTLTTPVRIQTEATAADGGQIVITYRLFWDGGQGEGTQSLLVSPPLTKSLAQVNFAIGGMCADEAGNIVYVVDETTPSVLGISTESGRLVRRTPLAVALSTQTSLAIAADTATLFLLDGGNKRVLRFELPALTLIDTWSLNFEPISLVQAATGTLYCTSSDYWGYIRQLDPSTGAVIRQFGSAKGSIYMGALLRLNPTGERLFLTERGLMTVGGPNFVYEFDVAETGAPALMKSHPYQQVYCNDFAVDAEYRRLYTMNGGVIGSGGYCIQVTDMDSGAYGTGWTLAGPYGVAVSVPSASPYVYGASGSPYDGGVTRFNRVTGERAGVCYLGGALENESLKGTVNGCLLAAMSKWRGDGGGYQGSDWKLALVGGPTLVLNNGPTAVATVTPLTVAPGMLVTCNGLGSSDPDGGSLQYRWEFGDGAVATTAAATHTYPVNGTYTVLLIVTDDEGLSAQKSVVVTVNRLPVPEAQSLTTNEDTALAFTLLATDPDGDALTYSIATSPGKGTLSGTAPALTYTPRANGNGSDSFIFNVSDGWSTATATVSIAIIPVNDPPVAGNQSVLTKVNTSVVVSLVANDIDTASLTYQVVQAPSHGTLSGVAPALTYTPASGFAGLDSFTYTASDGEFTSAIGTASIRVNLLPVAQAATIEVPYNSTKAFVLSASDADGQPLTYRITVNPAKGTISGVAPNLVYTPFVGETGVDSLSFVANDGYHDSTEATVSLLIDAMYASPTVSASASDTEASEPNAAVNKGTAKFRFTRTGSKVPSLTVKYTLSGMATNSIDYTPLSGTATIAAGATYVDVTLTALTDGVDEANETAIAMLAPDAAYLIDSANPSATVTIYNAAYASPIVNASAPDAEASEPYAKTNKGTAKFRFTRVGSLYGALKVKYGMSGTATDSIDYTPLSGTTTIAAGATYVDVTLTALTDRVDEANETAIATLASDAAYLIDSTKPSATVTIYNATANPWSEADLGVPTTVGVVAFIPTSSGFSLQGSGSLGSTADSGRYTWTTLPSDGVLVARVNTLSANPLTTRGGLMLRAGSSADVSSSSLVLTAGGSLELVTRDGTGEAAQVVSLGAHALPLWLRLTRTASGVAASCSTDGKAWTTLAAASVSLPAIACAGLWAGSGSAGLAQLDVDQVRTHHSLASSWMTLGGTSARSGRIAATFAEAPFVQRWQVSTGGQLNPPAVGNGLVFVTPEVYSAAGSIKAYCLTSGTMAWKYDVNSAYSINPPAFSDGRVFVQRGNHSSDTQLWCLSAATGTPMWNTSHGAQWERYFAPCPTNEGIYVNGGTYGGLYGFELPTGSQRFFASLDQYDQWAPAYVDGVVYSWVAGKFRAHLPTTGAVQWIVDCGWNFSGYSMNTVPVLSGASALLRGNGALHVVDLPSRTKRWTITGSFAGTPAADEVTAYALIGNTLNAYRLDNGTILRSWNAGAVLIGQPIVTDDTVIVASSSAAWVLDREAFTVLQTLPVGGHAALAGRYLALADSVGRLTLFESPLNRAPVAESGAWAEPSTVTLPAGTTVHIFATDPDGDALAYAWTQASGPAPALFATPEAAGSAVTFPVAGTYVLQVTVSDGRDQTMANEVTVTVNSKPNAAPAAVAQNVTTAEDATKAIVLAATDVDGDALTYSVVTIPAHGTLTGTGATRTYTPAANYNGVDSFTFNVNDGTVDSDEATVSITVTPVNDAPAATAQAVTTAEETAKSITLAGTDVDGDELTYEVVTAPAHGVLTGTGATRTYTPAANYNGADSFTFNVNDGTVDSDEVTVSITVTPVNDAPTIATVASATPNPVTGTTAVLAVLGADVDNEESTLTYGWSCTVKPTGVADPVFSVNNSNAAKTCTATFSAAGAYTLQVTVMDSGNLTATSSVEVTVIQNLPVVSLTTTDTYAAEPKNNGTFRLARVAAADTALTVKYAVSGTATNGEDYNRLSGSAIIPANATFVNVSVITKNDTMVEGKEAVILTLTPDQGYAVGTPAGGTVELYDDELPIVTVSTPDSYSIEGSTDTGRVRFTRSGVITAGLVVNYTVAGSAVNGVDYQALSGSVTIAVGATYADVIVTSLEDAVMERIETVELTLSAHDAYQVGQMSMGTVNLYDNDHPVVSLSATDPVAVEGTTDTAKFRINRSGSTTAALTVRYTTSSTATNGVDYQAMTGTAEIVAGKTFVDIVVVPLADDLVEGEERITVTLVPDAAYQVHPTNSTTLRLLDSSLPIFGIAAPDGSAAEPADTGTFRLTRSGNTALAVTVNLTPSGTAVNGIDYQSLPASVAFAAGETVKDVTLTPIDDSLKESQELVRWSISANSVYQIGAISSAVVYIADND